MKIKPLQIPALKDAIQKTYAAALVFGPDAGVAEDCANQIASYIVPDVRTSLSVAHLYPAALKENPAAVMDECNSPALFGGRKLIWLHGADTLDMDALDAFLNQAGDAFLLMTADNLGKSAAIRILSETHQKALAVACYGEDLRDIQALIHKHLADAGFSPSPDAVAFMAARLSDNRTVLRGELDKLITYMGTNKRISLADAQEIISDNAASSGDEFCCAVAEGAFPAADKLCQALIAKMDKGPSPVWYLTAHFNKLLLAADMMRRGSSVEQAVKKILRPAQFKIEPRVQSQLRLWDKKSAAAALVLLTETEQALRSATAPVPELIARAVIQIAGLARKLKNR
ncbi:MAG: DNA polymerase III subunit delta [Alphaproteobacteria bacterium]|nr:DNA polymerase III subunit delta [Alphaproteobacteria bacterium]